MSLCLHTQFWCQNVAPFLSSPLWHLTQHMLLIFTVAILYITHFIVLSLKMPWTQCLPILSALFALWMKPIANNMCANELLHAHLKCFYCLIGLFWDNYQNSAAQPRFLVGFEHWTVKHLLATCWKTLLQKKLPLLHFICSLIFNFVALFCEQFVESYSLMLTIILKHGLSIKNDIEPMWWACV